MRTSQEIIREFKELRDKIPDLIQESGYKDKYIYDQMGINKSTYYRRKSNPDYWSIEELEMLFRLLKK